MFDPTRLKVCFLAGTLGRGGAERQLVYMLRALGSAGVRTRVLCLTEGEPIENEIRALGVKVEHVSDASRSRARKLVRIVRSLRREPAEILQSVHFYTNLYVAAAGRLTDVKEIGAIRSNLSFDLESNGRLGPFHLRSPRHLITNSVPARQQAIAKGISPLRVHLVPNVVDVIKSNGHNGSKPNGAVRILFAGRLTEEKRADRFLRVVSRVVNQAPKLKVKAVLVGDGPLRPSLEILAGSLGLGAGQLELLGECEDMAAIYRRSDLVMLTSDLEGTPNVLLEAMARGLPVAATRVGGVPEIVTEERGLLVEPEDEEGLANAALKLLSNSDLRREMGQSGKDYVSKFHSLEKLPQQLTDIYRKVLCQ